MVGTHAAATIQASSAKGFAQCFRAVERSPIAVPFAALHLSKAIVAHVFKAFST